MAYVTYHTVAIPYIYEEETHTVLYCMYIVGLAPIRVWALVIYNSAEAKELVFTTLLIIRIIQSSTRLPFQPLEAIKVS